MQNKILILCLFLITSGHTFSQLYTSKRDKTIGETKNIVGSPYLNDSFIKGAVYDAEEQVNKDFFIRYNVYEDYIEAKEFLKSEIIFELSQTENSQCVIDGKTYKYFDTQTKKGVTIAGFFEVLNEGEKIIFLKKLSKSFNPSKPAENSYKPAVPAKYIDYEKYYFVIDDTIFEIKLKKKKVLSDFFNNNKEIENYAEKEKLKSEADFIKLVQYYNSL